jgi:DNA ligase D-like protein (predicted 3'-phosphoesterase)
MKQGLEGIMAKRLGSPYEPGARSRAWLKVKPLRTCDCVVFGYPKGEGVRVGTFGALVLGLCDQGKGVSIGRVGTGFDQADLESITSTLAGLKAGEPTLTGAEKGEIAWVHPRMVVEVVYQSVTRDGRLRMPRFVRIRTDKAPEECTPDQLGTEQNLLPYEAKRDFTMTPEPSGKKAVESRGNSFVVHEHRARHLHYDLRMERGGVLKSWAVPKGIPEAEGEKHLAVETEDHPLEYLTFEGTIPEGQYGAGTVKIWDKGTFELLEKTDRGFVIKMNGKKLKGVYVLFKFKPPKNWLFFKKKE